MQTKLQLHDKAQKVGGMYQATGTIVAVFHTTAGAERYVFEFDVPKGMLHIFTPEQLEVLRREDSQLEAL